MGKTKSGRVTKNLAQPEEKKAPAKKKTGTKKPEEEPEKPEA